MDLCTQIVVSPGSPIAGAMPRAASIENPSTNLNDPAIWDILTDGRTSAAGVKVTHRRALTVPAVWQALSLISGDVAKLPFDLFQKLADGDRRKAEDHPCHWLVRRKPNREMGAFKFWRRTMVHLLFWNNSYALIVRDGAGRPVELLPLLPDRTNAERKNGQLIYVSEVGGELKAFFPEQIFHLEGVACDNLEGFEFIHAAREAVGSALAAIQFASKFYRNGGRVGGILELPLTMNKQVRDKVEEGFRKNYENVDDAFKTVILRDNAKFHAAQQSLRDTQMIEGRRESVRDVARYFNIRPSKLGEESTVSYASKSEDNRDYLDTTLSHPLAAIASEAFDKLLSPAEQKGGFYFEHNTGALLALNMLDQSAAWAKLRAVGVLSANEIRGQLNLNRRQDPGGDSYDNPNTASKAAAAAAGVDRVAAAHRKIVAEGLARVVGVLGNKVEAAAKTPDDAIAWSNAKLPEWRETVERQVAAGVEAHAAIAGFHPSAKIARLAEATLEEFRAMVFTAADGCPAGRLKIVLRDAIKDFQQRRCPELAAILTEI